MFNYSYGQHHECFFFFFNDPPTPEIYTLSLHDALPIYRVRRRPEGAARAPLLWRAARPAGADRKSTRLNSSHVEISYAVFCLKKKKKTKHLFSSVVALYYCMNLVSFFNIYIISTHYPLL